MSSSDAILGQYGISAACQTQSDEIDKVGRAISEVDEATQRNTQLVEAAAFSADCLRDQAASLVSTVDVFKLGSHGHLARQESAAVSALSRIASGAV